MVTPSLSFVVIQIPLNIRCVSQKEFLHCYFKLFTASRKSFSFEGEIVIQFYPFLIGCKICNWFAKIKLVSSADCMNL
jgi:hypothetical protein